MDTTLGENVVMGLSKLTLYKVNFLSYFSLQIRIMALKFHMLTCIH